MDSRSPVTLDRVLEPVGRCLSPDVARALVALRTDPDVQAQLEYLADRSTEGMLSAEEGPSTRRSCARSTSSPCSSRRPGGCWRALPPLIEARLRAAVRRRAKDRCEYCRLSQVRAFAPFHVDHIIARQHGGGDDPDNLALACYRCNLRKGPHLTGLDPDTGRLTPVFIRAAMPWHEHFALRGARIVGLTALGRVTVQILDMNAVERVELRAELAAEGTEDGA